MTMNSIESSKNVLSEVRQLLHITLTIPVMSATAEQTFSAMRRLKSFLRSTMNIQKTHTLYISANEFF